MNKANLSAKKEIPNLMNQKIETKRLILKPISTKYKSDIFKEFDENVTSYMYPQPAKEISETEKFIQDSLNGLKKRTNFQLVILKKDSNEFLGCIGLHCLNKTPEFGIWLKKSAHGKKYGQEAITALKKWADKNIDYKYILYPVEKRNLASKKIPELLNGKIFREYSEKNASGKKLNLIEYHLFKKK